MTCELQTGNGNSVYDDIDLGLKSILDEPFHPFFGNGDDKCMDDDDSNEKEESLVEESMKMDLSENALKETNEACVTADVGIEDFITFDNKLETHQTYDSASFLEEKNNDDDDDDSETNDEPKIKDFKTAISYLEELQKFSSATISNSNLLELTIKARECAERAALNHKKQSNIKNYFSKL
ncbi:Hypothetical protein CINCED_3A022846 [Cinara cedri]|uniref:Uncharacterized protein n=1 Tax=Cinara cedri TaxID=506608 RepID=A0A5E4NL14_9HEMI|nr:Hypothetical protein CINCED_3A022846 [Cinara cedri]